jgi:hypothetical protein
MYRPGKYMCLDVCVDVIGHYVLERLSEGHYDKDGRAFCKGCPMSFIPTLA